jgi:predicted negative regulator of RcsB-dependent stress response
MDEDLSIIDTNTRNEKIKNFFVKNKRKLITILIIIILSLFSYFGYKEFKKRQKIEISNLYNSIIVDFSENNRDQIKEDLINLIKKKDPTYSVLSLYFLIDNDLVSDLKNINELFDILIYETSLEKEIKNLIIYKKALINAESTSENDLLEILSPIINSKSVWKSHALFLLGEYFFSKDQKQKSKEFFSELMLVENANQDLKKKARKRLNRDLSE